MNNTRSLSGVSAAPQAPPDAEGLTNLVGPAPLAAAWRRAFAGTPVVVREGDILAAAQGAALVSPANSFGWMTGGLDLGIWKAYAPAVDITARVQAAIAEAAGGELPVGQALVVPTPEGPFAHLICAPTMRGPRPVRHSLNAYLAFRAVLVAVRAWNAAHPDDTCPAVYCPGLATGVGRMPAPRAARQMRAAWNQVMVPGPVPPLWQALAQELRWQA